MSGKPTAPYHIAEQYADALLRPVGATLVELDERLTQFADRLHLADDDRRRVERAKEIVVEARRELEAVFQVGAFNDRDREAR